jgi:hypothetical protein
VNARKNAQRLLDKLRVDNDAELGRLPVPVEAHEAAFREVANRFLANSLIPEQGQDPQMRKLVTQIVDRGVKSVDNLISEMWSELQDNIEKTAAARIEGLDLGSRRPLIGHLRTGQLNAVCMSVPGRSGAYLVLIEDQMQLFSGELSEAVAWAIPAGPADANGMINFNFSLPAVTERVEAYPEIAARFAEIIVSYAVKGTVIARRTQDADAVYQVADAVDQVGDHMMPPGYLNLARMLCTSLEYFVLGHEYAHILLGHLDTGAIRRDVPPAAEAEARVYSWREELAADWMGSVLSINAIIEHEHVDIPLGFFGISLFFDALDVMDRAVALLQTGDENARQLGSHPPSELRKQRLLRDVLPALGGSEPANAGRVEAALLLAEVQTKIIRMLWERTRPILLDLRRRGVPAAHTWRTIPKETDDGARPN